MMSKPPQTFTSFGALARHMADERQRSAQAQNAEDVRRANNLRRSRSLARSRKQGVGPRVAR